MNLMSARVGKYIRFAIAMSVVAIMWTVVLPWLAARPQIAQHLDRLEAQGIDGGAMFYTELDAMEPILRRIEARH